MAAELAGAQDQILRTLEEHLSADIFLRGNVVTLDGDAEAVQLAATVVRELSELVARGHEIGPATIESVARVLDQAESPSQVLDEVVWRHRNLKVAPEVGQPEALHGRDQTLHDHVRDRPGRNRQDVPGDGHGHRRPVAARGQPHHPHPPRGRGRRAPGVPARRPDGQGRPVPAPAVRRTARHDGRRARRRPPRARRDRGRAAGLHAWSRPTGRPAGPHARGVPRDRHAAGRRSGGRLGRPPDARAGRVPPGPQAGLPRRGAGRRFDALLRRAPVVRDHARRSQARQAGSRARDARDDRDGSAGTISIASSSRWSARRSSSSRETFRSIRTRSDCCWATGASPRRPRQLLRRPIRSSPRRSRRRCRASSCVARARSTTSCDTSMGTAAASSSRTPSRRRSASSGSRAHVPTPSSCRTRTCRTRRA